MGCGSSRDKGPPEYTQKWEYITLSEFKSNSAWNGVAYAWLWILAIIAVAVYVVDTITAVNLLVYDRWNSSIQPALPFKYSKWIFAICILLSWALCLYEWMRAIRVIRRGGVAESYMDPVAVSLQSMRGSGWRRFLVFGELTKSKKGADYIALFVYFAFKGAIRVILAEGPRQAINAMSLWAVTQAELIPHTTTKNSDFDQFWINLGNMAEHNHYQAIIFFSMLFTLVIWVFSALCLIAAAICYLLFLWHYIPQADGRLSIYCRRKIDRRLEKIVERKIIAANEEEERNRVKYAKKIEALQMKSGGETAPLPPPKLVRAPTLPQLGDQSSHDEASPKAGLARQNTNNSVATLPQYTRNPPPRNEHGRWPGQPSGHGTSGDRRDMLPRLPTEASVMSYDSQAPLLANAGYAGHDQLDPREPSIPAPGYRGQAPSYSPMRSRFGSQSTIQSSRSYGPGVPRTVTPGPQGPPRYGTLGPPGPPRYGTPGTMANNAMGPSQDGPMSPMRHGTPLSAIQGTPEHFPPRHNSPAPPMPRMPTATAWGNAPLGQPGMTTTSNSMPIADTGFDFGLSSSDTPPPSHVPPQPLYKPLVLGPVSTWQKVYDDRPFAPAFTTLGQHDSGRGAASSDRSFSPVSIRNDLRASSSSYEMKNQPVHTSPTANVAAVPVGAYVAFKPTLKGPASIAPSLSVKTEQLSPSSSVRSDRPSSTRSVSPVSAMSATVPQDYFGNVSSGATSLGVPATGENRLTVLGYGDIIDEYGAAHVPTPVAHPMELARSTSITPEDMSSTLRENSQRGYGPGSPHY